MHNVFFYVHSLKNENRERVHYGPSGPWTQK